MVNFNSTLYLSISSLIYTITIAIIFFCKKKINTIENRIYKKQIIYSIICVCTELCILLVTNYFTSETIINISLKIFNLSVLTWIFNFCLYSFVISHKEENIDYKSKYKMLYWMLMSIFVICGIVIIILPIKLSGISSEVYSSGPSVDFLYGYCTISLICMIFLLLKNRKNLKEKGYYPIILFVLLMISIAVIQNRFPNILLVNWLFGFEILIMYHTIENPDMKLIEQLNIAKDQAEKANQAKTDFLSSMSHEIRTPLNAIVGFSEALKEEELSSEAREEVNDIIMASDSLIEIVNGILDISKIEANKLEIINTEYSFKKIFDELVVLTKARMGESAIDFRVVYDESIPQTLYGDYARIKQIVLNLLTNAVKYTKEGYIEFKVSSIIKNNICRLIISVEDTGFGIKKEDIDKLFTKFERLQVEKKTTAEGTGLGLAITKKLVELMNGKIIVQSIFGKGSKFTVSIDQSIVYRKQTVEVKPEESIRTDFTGKTVLLVDDNTINLKVANRLLRSFNLDVTECLSGIEAIENVKNIKFDLILLDDMMPKMSGTETLVKFKEIEGFDTPVVALTANAISGMREKYLGLGFNDYLSKPINKDELNRVINKYLSK